MDQASASPAASYARNPAAPRTSSSCSQSADRARTVGPLPARSGPQSGLHSEPVHIAPRSSSSALRRFEAKGHRLPDFYSGATGIPGCFSEGLLLRRSQIRTKYWRHGCATASGTHSLSTVLSTNSCSIPSGRNFLAKCARDAIISGTSDTSSHFGWSPPRVQSEYRLFFAHTFRSV